jgi:hypothetical protein
MRIATPCSENLDAMPRNSQGDFLCDKCDRAVVDLRRAPRKRALSVIADLRKVGDGSVCVRVNAKRDGTPVFAPDPSPFARFVGPIALVGSLAACSPQVARSERSTTPATLVEHAAGSNVPPGTTTHTTPAVGVGQPPPGSVVNASTIPPEVVPMAGGLAFSD